MKQLFSPVLVHDYLSRTAECLPNKTALIFGTQRFSYAELDKMSGQLASFFRRNGLKHQERVVIFMDNSPHAVIALYGALKAGCVFVLLNGTMKAGKLAYILKDSQASWMIADTAKWQVVMEALTSSAMKCQVQWVGNAERIPDYAAGAINGLLWEDAFNQVEVDGNNHECSSTRRILDIDMATLIYTSGSTGEPKGVISAHCNVVAAAQSIIQYLENTPDDVVLNCLPLSFDYGLYQVIMAFMYGGTVVLIKSFMFIHEILTQIAAERVSGFPVVPTIVAMLFQLRDLSKYDLSMLRYVTNTAAAFPVEHIIKIRTLLPKVRLYSMFGLTECKRVCYLSPDEIDRRPSSVGKAMPNCETFIVDDTGNPVPPGQVGELVIRGQNVMQGYWNEPELTESTFRPGRYPGERLLYSGDLFKMDEEGYLYFLGRKGDMIKSRGERISPKEIEAILCRIEGIAETAVIGVQDEIMGEAVKAFVVQLPGEKLGVNDILKYCKDHMEPFMVPKFVQLIDNLPRSPNGKIDKAELRSSSQNTLGVKYE